MRERARALVSLPKRTHTCAPTQTGWQRSGDVHWRRRLPPPLIRPSPRWFFSRLPVPFASPASTRSSVFIPRPTRFGSLSSYPFNSLAHVQPPFIRSRPTDRPPLPARQIHQICPIKFRPFAARSTCPIITVIIRYTVCKPRGHRNRVDEVDVEVDEEVLCLFLFI